MNGTALITGAARRIGRAITLGLAEDGWDIALHYNGSSAEAEELGGLVEKAGRTCGLFRADLARAGAAEGLISSVFDACPDCNLLVNNASVFTKADFLAMDEAALDHSFAVNFRAPFFLSQAFARRCAAGHIINIADARVARVTTAHFAYALSKKLLWDFTKMAAKRLGPTIRVNAVCPGLIIPAEGQNPEAFDELSAKLPLKQAGSPSAVAAAVVFLCRARYVTGQAIFVDGGEHLM